MSARAGCTRARRRTRSTGPLATYMSISGIRTSGATRTSPKTGGPMVVVATHGVHALPHIADSSNRKLQAVAPRRHSDGTRWRAPRRGDHAGPSSTAASASTVTRADATGHRHAGGITRVSADGLTPLAAVKRSVCTVQRVERTGVSFGVSGGVGEIKLTHASPWDVAACRCAPGVRRANGVARWAPPGAASWLPATRPSSPVASCPSDTSLRRPTDDGRRAPAVNPLLPSSSR